MRLRWEGDEYGALTPRVHRYRFESEQDGWRVIDDCCPPVEENGYGLCAYGFDTEAEARDCAAGWQENN
jgi:hypothetical protein